MYYYYDMRPSIANKAIEMCSVSEYAAINVRALYDTVHLLQGTLPQSTV